MNIFELYINTKKSIEYNNLHLRNIDKKINTIKKSRHDVKAVSYDKERVQSSLDEPPVNEVYKEINQLMKERNIYKKLAEADDEMLEQIRCLIGRNIKTSKKETFYKVFVLHYLKGLSFQECSDALNISLDHVYRCNGIIKQKLKEAETEYYKIKNEVENG